MRRRPDFVQYIQNKRNRKVKYGNVLGHVL